MPQAISHPTNSSIRYVRHVCIAFRELSDAIGVGSDGLARLLNSGCIPQPTYRVYSNGAVVSAVRRLGEPVGASLDYYSPAVIWWLRRASTLAPSLTDAALPDALKRWLKSDLSAALLSAANDAHRYKDAFSWSHLLDQKQIIESKLEEEINKIWDDWMSGAWAVCLRRFDGYHLVTKEIERARIASITNNGERGVLDRQSRLQLFDAISRLDSVILPFAPHERPHGTPGLFIDAMLERYQLLCPTSEHSIDWRVAC